MADIRAGSLLGPLLFLINISTTYQVILKGNVDCLLMTHLCFLYFMTLILPGMILIMIQRKLVNRLFIWKMKFNPNPTKQALKKLYLAGKKLFLFTQLSILITPRQTQWQPINILELYYSKLSFENHLHSVFSRVNKTVDLLRKFQPNLPRKSLVTIYKSFVRPHLDYGDVVYD